MSDYIDNQRFRCRGCGQDYLSQALFLGNLAIVKFKNSPEEKDDRSPLNLVKCENCQLIQLEHSVPPERLYSNFHYLSGINQSMNDALFDIVKEVERVVDLKPGDIVVDIGANDGTLLSYYRRYIWTVGFEPAKNIRRPDHVQEWIQLYFSANEYGVRHDHVGSNALKAKVVTAIAMFYDLEDPNKFLKDVREILADDGIFVIQMNDLDSMTQNISIDNICHEHLCYYNMDTLLPLLRRNNLYPISVSYNGINGGSIRVICSKTSNDKLFHSVSTGTYSIEIMWRSFESEKKRLLKYIDKAHERKGLIMGYGASTRGYTLLQLLGLTSNDIVAIADRNPKKRDKFLGDIPICSEETMRALKPVHLLVLPYYFENEFLTREIEYLKKGGRMIFPLPRFRIWTADKEGNLKVHGLKN